MDDLTTTQGIVALAAAGVAAVAVIWLIVLSVKLRRLRSAQRIVLGGSGDRDLAQHASDLEQAFIQLRDWVEETAGSLEQRMGTAESRVDGCVAYTSLVR